MAWWQQPTCHFNFPKDCQNELQSILNSWQQLEDRELTVDEITHAKATLTTKRNDERINSQNRVMLHHWRANVLFKPLLTLTNVSGTWRTVWNKSWTSITVSIWNSHCVWTGSIIQTWLHLHYYYYLLENVTWDLKKLHICFLELALTPFMVSHWMEVEGFVPERMMMKTREIKH